MLNNLRHKIAEYFLNSEIKNSERNREVHNIRSARRVGVIYDATNRETYETVKKFIHYLKEERKQVSTLGFIDTKDENQLITPKLEYDFFSRIDLNWLNRPNKLEVDNFIEERFDILIDLNTSNCFPLKYICALSKAKFKVGKFGVENRLYDFMVNIEEGVSFKQFIVQLRHYLKMINTTNEQKV